MTRFSQVGLPQPCNLTLGTFDYEPVQQFAFQDLEGIIQARVGVLPQWQERSRALESGLRSLNENLRLGVRLTPDQSRAAQEWQVNAVQARQELEVCSREIASLTQSLSQGRELYHLRLDEESSSSGAPSAS